MEIIYCEQGGEEWHLHRAGIVTMSEVACLLVNGKSKSGLGAGAFTYMDKILAERMTGEPALTWAGNAHTQRGHELEPEALDLYCAEEGVSEAARDRPGIILNHGVGYSPDMLVGAVGAAEVKTKLPNYMVGLMLAGEVPKEHLPQCQGGLWVSEREWLDFVGYWPGMPLFIKRIYRDEDMISHIAERCELFYNELEKRWQRLREF